MSDLYERNVIEDIVRAASAMLFDQVGLIEGVRRINHLRLKLRDSSDPVFFPIVAFESETEGYPLGEKRQYWSSEYLASQDAKIEEWIENAREDLKETCSEIIAKFSRQ